VSCSQKALTIIRPTAISIYFEHAVQPTTKPAIV
jgi:hypothetical protein